jgi:hypothetical protein
MHRFLLASFALLSSAPHIAALTYSFSHRALAEPSAYEFAWALVVLVAIPVSIAFVPFVLFGRLRLLPARLLVAAVLPAVSALSILVLTGHYVLDHLVYGDSPYIAYLGYLAGDLKRARHVMALGAAASTTLSVVCYCLSLRSVLSQVRGFWLLVAPLAAAISFTLLNPHEWTTELGSNWAFGNLLMAALAVAALIVVFKTRHPMPRPSGAA